MLSSDPDREADEAGDPERREAGEERGGQRRDDLQRQRGRVELHDRGGEHAERAGQEGGEQRARRGRAGWARDRRASRPTSFSEAARVARP